MTALYVTKISEIDVDTLFLQERSRLNEYYNAKIIKYRHCGAKRRALFSALLLAHVAEQQGIAGFNKLHIDENEYGKPHFRDYPDFHFNLSHSGAWVVCAIDDCPVGVDVQELCSRTDIDIAERFFCEIEKKMLRLLPEQMRRERFFELWALKESFIKAEGKGLSIALDSFGFAMREEQITLFAKPQLCNWQFRLYALDAGYKLALCIARGGAFPELLHVTIR